MNTKLDIERAFTFVFKDPKWLEKVAIGAVLTITIIGSPALTGWVMEIQKRVQNGEDDTLPEWDNLGEYFIEGLKLILVNFVWYLPFLLIYFLFMIPFMGMPLLASLLEDAESIVNIFFFGIMMIPYLVMPIMMVASFLMYTLIPVYTGMYLENREIKDAFNFRQAFELLKVNFWVLLASAFLGYLAAQVVGMVGMMLCFVGLFLVSPISSAIMFHFFGQAYRISKIKLEAKKAAQLEGNAASTDAQAA